MLTDNRHPGVAGLGYAILGDYGDIEPNVAASRGDFIRARRGGNNVTCVFQYQLSGQQQSAIETYAENQCQRLNLLRKRTSNTKKIMKLALM